jgi:hypothetical protein
MATTEANRVRRDVENKITRMSKGAAEDEIAQALEQNFAMLSPTEQQRALVALRRYIGPVRFEQFIARLKTMKNLQSKQKALKRIDLLVRRAEEEAAKSFSSRPGLVHRQFNESTRNLVRRVGRAPRSKWIQQNAHDLRKHRGYETIEAKILKSPGNGNCLFHSIAQHLFRMRSGRYARYPENLRERREIDSTIIRLRRIVSEYYARHPEETVIIETGQTLTASEYSAHIVRPGTYGGAEDMKVLSDVYKFPIILYTKVDSTLPFVNSEMNGLFKKMFPMIIGDQYKRPPLLLLYSPGSGANPELGAHYDVLYRSYDRTPNVRPRQQAQMIDQSQRPQLPQQQEQRIFRNSMTMPGVSRTWPYVLGALCSVSSILSFVVT